MERDLLCINAGSSSLKFAVFRSVNSAERRLLSGEIERIGEKEGRFRLYENDGLLVERRGAFGDHAQAAREMFQGLKEQGSERFIAAGHRIVHGGPEFFDPQLVDRRLCERLRKLIAFAPLHLPSQIAIVEGVAQHWPEMPQVVCFDTAFHRAIPEIARRFPLPRKLWDKGIFRYGFHGLSYEYVVEALGDRLGQRSIVAHLGNGASMVALKDREPVDTSMALTPAAGFMMGTRSGDLDPGILLYLLRQGWAADELAMMIEHESGLAGVSELTSDMKTLLRESKTNPRCAQAVAMFCYQVRKFIGAYAAALDGLDTLVFTGGIGERAPEIRAGICDGLAFLGITLDEGANRKNAAVISRNGSPCAVRVIQTDEDVMIARHTRDKVLRTMV